MAAQQAMNFLPMEDELRNDAQGVLRGRLLDDLAQQSGKIKRILDSGVAPAEFERWYSLHAAVAAATATVDKVWQRFHPA
ncbi:MAG: hypothetical protein U1F68_00310 [Gammaproteobacteria bacterium]